MIIPKAKFLRHSYNKNKVNQQHLLKFELTNITSVIVNGLRKPANHKRGNLEFRILNSDYPILTSIGGTKHLSTMLEQFSCSGYVVQIKKDGPDGLLISLDWTQNNLNE